MEESPAAFYSHTNLLGRSADEITQELNLSPAAVQKVLSTLNE